MPAAPVVMLACYQVDPGNRTEFLSLLKETELVYREEAVLTESPILRMESLESTGSIVEVIEWKSMETLGAVQENERIQAKWSEIKSRWLRGDFPIREIPESNTPWAILRSLA